MRRTLTRYGGWLLAGLTLGVCLAGAGAVSVIVSLPSEDEFNVVRWELRHLPGKWVYLAGRYLRGGLSPEEEDERLGRFLVLSARIWTLERGETEGGRHQLASLRRERDTLENDVEAIIEGRLSAALEEAGLQSSLPLFPNARLVWPPVDVEFDRPPPVLAVSPRERIELVEQRPLRPGLSVEEAVEAERAEEREGDRSALVEALSGAATYPSALAPHGHYQRLLETAAHEWVHHYLAFKPLGLRYFSSLELQTMNETVASLAGEELAAMLARRHPLPADAARRLEALLPQEAVDAGGALRTLRLEVEALLAAEQVEAAEALMERRRQELAAQGVFFRRINQAFFAFRNVYATDPASIDPLGEQLRELRRRTGSVGAFLRAASGLTSGAELERLLGADYGRRW